MEDEPFAWLRGGSEESKIYSERQDSNPREVVTLTKVRGDTGDARRNYPSPSERAPHHESAIAAACSVAPSGRRLSVPPHMRVLRNVQDERRSPQRTRLAVRVHRICRDVSGGTRQSPLLP